MLLLNFSLLNAFDDKREGLLIGLGLGLGSQGMELSDGTNSVSEEYSTIATSFKIGYGFSENFTLYYASYVNWYDLEFYSNNGGTFNESMVSGVAGVGATYFFSENDSFYVSGVIGLGTMAAVDYRWYEIGKGGFISLGYEWKNRFSIEAVLQMQTELTSDINSNLKLKTLSQQLILQYSWY